MKGRWRKFLETPRSGVDSYVAVTWDLKDDWPDASLKVADCDERVNLYFNLKYKKDIERARRKLSGLYEALDRLDALITHAEETR